MKTFFGKVLLIAAVFLMAYFLFTWTILTLSWALRLLEPAVIMTVVLVVVVCGFWMLWSKR